MKILKVAFGSSDMGQSPHYRSTPYILILSLHAPHFNLTLVRHPASQSSNIKSARLKLFLRAPNAALKLSSAS